MRRITTLQCEPIPSEDALISRYAERYAGTSTHRLQCGQCGYEVAVGVDPYLYPAMFEGASHIACSQCASINALPVDL